MTIIKFQGFFGKTKRKNKLEKVKRAPHVTKPKKVANLARAVILI